MALDLNQTPKSYKRKKSITFPESTIKIGKKCIIRILNKYSLDLSTNNVFLSLKAGVNLVSKWPKLK